MSRVNFAKRRHDLASCFGQAFKIKGYMRKEEIQLLEDLKKVFADLKKTEDVIKILDEKIKEGTESDKKTNPEKTKDEKSIDQKIEKSGDSENEYNKQNTQYFEHPLIYSGPKPTVTHTENYKEGDSSLFVPGTYLQIIRQHEYLMGSGLFGYTTPSMGFNVVVRGDLKGEPFRDVRNHESYHWTQRAGELDTRDATGTHMDVFLPKLHKMYNRV